nr:GntR family transcriptional regulator [Kribbella pratensis]
MLTQGEPLPPEKTLAARYGVAASTAHRAVAMLVAAGLVTASCGKRATVATRGEPEVASVTELRLSKSP